MRKLPITASLMASAAFMSSYSASAQTSAPAAPERAASDATPAPVDSSPAAGDIIVTANRVATSAQRTSVALTAYSGEDLVRQGVTNIAALQSIDPSVNLTQTTGTSYVAIRGVASSDVTQIGDPAVPIARDGFFTNRSYGVATSMYDLRRVEVLKGPQGTLQGRNSTGGLISIITNRPVAGDHVFGSVEVGNYGEFHGEMGTNLDLASWIQIRASGIFFHHNGYRLSSGTNQRQDDEDVGSGRFQVALTPTDRLHIWASFQHDSTDQNGDSVLNSPLGTRPVLSRENAKNPFNAAPGYYRLKDDRVRWEATYNITDGIDLTYSGGYDEIHWANAQNKTGPGYPATRQFRQTENPRTFNHEVRISTSADNPFSVQGGFFNFSEKNAVVAGLYNIQAGAPVAGTPLDTSGTYGILFDYPSIKQSSNAVFGQATYKFSDYLKVSGGARYTWDKKEQTGVATLLLNALVSPFAPPITIQTLQNGKSEDKKPSFHGGIDYTPNKTSLIYAKFDSGYKAGGFNSNGSGSPVVYGPETITSYEVGTKNRFFGNILLLNVDAFYMDYRGYQASQSSGVLNGNGVFNVGSAKIYGAEAQATVALPGLGRLDTNLTYLHTRFGSGITVTDGGSTTREIGGNRLPNSPSLVATAGYEYPLHLESGVVTARVDGKYSSSYYYSVFNDADTQSRAFVTGNASLTFAPSNGVWDVQIFVRNFTDKVVLANAQRDFVSNLNTYQFQPPRTFGGRFSFRY
jgi:iron complex outermembrane receptor protein